MTTLNDFFSKPTNLLHPRLRNWSTRLHEPGTSATLAVFRPETALGESQPEMNVQFAKDGEPLPLETVSWDDELNAGLIALHVRAVSPDQEAQRFALGLRAAMRKVEREFGNGHLNAVLIELLKDSDLMRQPQIAAVLEHAYALRADRESKGYSICREMIADAISGRAQELVGPLKYSQEEAKAILVDALGRYLDERFSVSSRRQLGLL